MGIDLGNNGVTLNDGGSDPDTGANDLQDFPIVFSVTTSGTGTTIAAQYFNTPSTIFSFEFFASSTCDPSGYGEGERLLGAAGFGTSPAGFAGFAIALPAVAQVGEFVTMTATAPNASTSEFSLCFVVPTCAGDLDCDSVPNGSDNCPSVYNPGAGQTTNSDSGNAGANHAGTDALGDACDPDDDGDGYTDTSELSLGKNPLSYCTIMRADVDGDGAVSILDLSMLADVFNQPVTPAIERLNQDADGVISILDLSAQADVFVKPVTLCP